MDAGVKGPGGEQEGWVGLQRKSWRGEEGLEPVGMWSRERERHWNSLRYVQVRESREMHVSVCVLRWAVCW